MSSQDDYKYKYMKYKTKYLDLIGGNNDLIFVFFNGGGLTDKQWFEHPYKNKDKWLDRTNENEKTDLIEKIKQFGDVYLYTPVFYMTQEDATKGKTFSLKDLDLINHCKELYEKIKDHKRIFLISHSRGNILAKFFCSIYNDKVIGYINIDGGESPEWYKKYFSKLDDKYKSFKIMNDTKLNDLFNDEKNNYNVISQFVKFSIYKQSYELKYEFNDIKKMIILNNIYNDTEIKITDQSYVKDTLMSKIDFNKQFENNKNVKSIYYVGKSHYLYFYDDVVDDIICYVKNIV